MSKNFLNVEYTDSIYLVVNKEKQEITKINLVN